MTDEQLTKECEIKEELVRLAKMVRGKYKDLQRDTEDGQHYLEASAKPLSTPLKKMLWKAFGSPCLCRLRKLKGKRYIVQ